MQHTEELDNITAPRCLNRHALKSPLLPSI
jgi:hypothetical protein